MWLIPALLVLAVIYLAHASDSDAAPTGTPNGVQIDAKTSMLSNPGPDNALPYLGATVAPSPFTGLGRPGASMQTIQLYDLAGNPRTKGNGSAFQHPPRLGGTGLLNPLPDRGTSGKRLVTQDVLMTPGSKL